MPRESPDYRDTLMLLNEQFKGRMYLTVEEIMGLHGYKSRASVYNKYPVEHGRVQIVTVARTMSRTKK